jgi:DNA primase
MAGRIPEHVIEEVLFRSDIVDVVSTYIDLKKAGSTYKACCPFHQEKTPSFNVNPDRQMYKCFGCGEGGNAIGFLMKQQGMDFITAVTVLAERCGVQLDVEEDSGAVKQAKQLREIHEGLSGFYRRCLSHALGQEAREYLKERGLDGDGVSDFGLGFAPGTWDAAVKWAGKQKYGLDALAEGGLVVRRKPESITPTMAERDCYYDRFRSRLMFPIHDTQGRVIAFSGRQMDPNDRMGKYVNSPETPIFHKSRVLYALHLARKHIVSHPNREALVCEGQIDVIRCHISGVPRAVAAQGTAFTTDHVHILKRYADSVVLVFDADAAGRKAAVKTARLFVTEGIVVRIAALPDGDDPDTFIIREGGPAFEKLVEEAPSTLSFQVDTLKLLEASPDSVSGTDRISRSVLETIALCPNAVQSARMLQEAARLLCLPEAALSEELAHHRERAKRGRSSRQAPAPSRPSPSTKFHDKAMPPRPAQPAAASAPPQADPFEFAGGEEDAELDDHGLPADWAPARGGGASAAVPTPAVRVDPPEERLLCEYLVHVTEEPALGPLVVQYLPDRLLRGPLCRQIVAACKRAVRDELDFHELIGESNDEELGVYVHQLVKQPRRFRGDDFSELEPVQDAILGLWRRFLMEERTSLAGRSLSDEEAHRRIQITYDLKSLQRWEAGVAVIESERLLLEDEPTTEAAG